MSSREGVSGGFVLTPYPHVRHTEDIDIVTTPEGLARIHSRLVGRGIIPRGAGLRKKLRDTAHKVNIDVLQAGEPAGAAGSPVRYPSPDGPEFAVAADGIRYATLSALLAFKIASGIWGKRPRDLADAQELVKANALAEDFARELPEPLRDRYVALVAAAREERDIE